MKSEGLLIFTFSPVQSFISSARKPRDLFTGSYILSYLAEQVILCLGEQKDVDVIYPQLDKNSTQRNQLANYPNRVVAIVKYEGNFPEGKHPIENLAKNKFTATWKSIYTAVLEKSGLIQNINNRVIDQFKSHVKDYFNVFTVCIPMTYKENWQKFLGISEDTNAENYGYTYDLAERILGAKKSWRPYRGQIDDCIYEVEKDSKRVKVFPNGCTMCGERLHLAINWGHKNITRIFKEEDARHIREGEKLCGVCIIKRFAVKYYFRGILGEDFWHYPSTEEIAGIKFKIALSEKFKGEKDKKEITDRVKDIINEFLLKTNDGGKSYAPYVLRKKPVDDDAYLDLDAELFRKDGWEGLFKDMELMLGKDKTTEVRKKISDLVEKIKERYNLEHKNPYYAILISDGDNIGDWLGIKSGIRKEILSSDFHKKFSKKLSEYAKEVTESWKDIFPRLTIYAGGDDLMALMHPYDVVSYAKLCNKKFNLMLKELAIESKEPSVSAGILITHAKMNLQKAINEARHLENKAKNTEGKGAVCVGVLTRSGNLTSFVAKWEDIDIYEELTRCFREGYISSSLAYDIRELVKSINEDDIEIFLALIKRTIKRKTDKNYDWNKLFSNIEGFIKKTQGYLEGSSIKNFANLLYVARFVGTLREVEFGETV